MQIALYETTDTPAAIPVDLAWDELCDLLGHVHPTDCPNGCQNPKQCPRKASWGAPSGLHAWSPAHFTKPYRLDRNVEAVTLAVLDLDHVSDTTLAEVAHKLEGFEYLCHTTHSHRPGSAALRLVMPLAAPVPAAQWPVVWASLVRELDLPVDPTCKNVSRFYYLPSLFREVEGFSVRGHGAVLDTRALNTSSAGDTPSNPVVRAGEASSVHLESANAESFDLTKIKHNLRQRRTRLLKSAKLKQRESGVILDSVLNGEALALGPEARGPEDIGRDAALNQACSILANVLPLDTPWAVTLEVIRPSIAAMDCAPEGLQHWIDEAEDMFTRGVARRKHREALQEAKNADLRDRIAKSLRIEVTPAKGASHAERNHNDDYGIHASVPGNIPATGILDQRGALAILPEGASESAGEDQDEDLSVVEFEGLYEGSAGVHASGPSGDPEGSGGGFLGVSSATANGGDLARESATSVHGEAGDDHGGSSATGFSGLTRDVADAIEVRSDPDHGTRHEPQESSDGQGEAAQGGILGTLARLSAEARSVRGHDSAPEGSEAEGEAPEGGSAEGEVETDPAKLLIWDSKGEGLKSCGVNVATILRYGQGLSGTLRYNEVSKSIEVHGGPWASESQQTLPVAVSNWFALHPEYRMNVDPRTIEGQIVYVAHKHSYDPLANHLLGLAWDGENRVDTFLERYFGAITELNGEDITRHVRRVSRCFLVQAVARALSPGCQADHVLVLEGLQGLGKTSALRILGGPWFCGTAMDIGSKDSRMLAAYSWIIELAELASVRRADNLTLKNFFTTTQDDFRPPYGRSMEKSPRRCVFVGSTNDEQYLTDPTGNRRYWPIACGTVDLEALTADRDMIWAEAVALYQAGVKWYLSKSEEATADTVARERLVQSEAIHAILEWWYGTHPSKRPAFVSAAHIAEMALHLTPDKISASVTAEIRNAATQMGFKRSRSRVNGVRVYGFEATPELMQAPQGRNNSHLRIIANATVKG